MKLSQVIKKWEDGWRGTVLTGNDTIGYSELHFNGNSFRIRHQDADRIEISDDWQIAPVDFEEAITSGKKIRPFGTETDYDFMTPTEWLQFMSGGDAAIAYFMTIKWEIGE